MKNYVHASPNSVYFQENGVVKYARTVTYGIMDLIGFFGGIIGLCVGFSLLSGAELIYYFTLRLFFDFKNEKENKVETLNDLDDVKSDKDILSDSFDAVFSLNNSTVDMTPIAEDKTEKPKPKPDVIPDEENKSLNVPKKVDTKPVSPKSTPKKAPVKPAPKPKAPATKPSNA